MKFLSSLIIVMFLVFPASGQFFEVTAKIMYGTFQMESLRNFQNDNYTYMPYKDLNFTITDAFPGNFGAEIQFLQQRETIQYGGYLSTITTGGRIFYADYSGILSVDNHLRSISGGGLFFYKLNLKDKNLQGYLGCSAGMSYVDHVFLTQLKLTGTSGIKDEIKFEAFNIMLGPIFKLNYPINQNFLITTSIGYNFNIPGKLFLKEDSEAYLINSGKEVKADFSGLRLGFGFGFNIR